MLTWAIAWVIVKTKDVEEFPLVLALVAILGIIAIAGDITIAESILELFKGE